MRARAALGLAAAVSLTVGVVAASPGEPSAPGEARLEARLVAPCCWTQTLDVHESEVSTALRREIHARLLAGESADAVEDNLVVRYGERIRAAPKGQELGAPIPVAVGAGMVLAAAALAALLRRWTQKARAAAPRAPAPPAATPAEPDRYDRALDAELSALDD